MRNLEMKVLTGTTLSLLLSAVSVLPAMARPAGELESEQLLTQVQTEPQRDQPGQQPNPRQQDLQGDPTTQPQRNQQGTPTNQTPGSRTVRGTIRTIDEDRVTIETPEGTREDIVIRPEDVTRLGLKPGSDVSVTVGSGNVATEVTLPREANSATTEDSTRTNTTTTQERVIQQRRTVETRPAPTRQAPQQTTSPQTQDQPAETDTQPVRALW